MAPLTYITQSIANNNLKRFQVAIATDVTAAKGLSNRCEVAQKFPRYHLTVECTSIGPQPLSFDTPLNTT